MWGNSVLDRQTSYFTAENQISFSCHLSVKMEVLYLMADDSEFLLLGPPPPAGPREAHVSHSWAGAHTLRCQSKPPSVSVTLLPVFE